MTARSTTAVSEFDWTTAVTPIPGVGGAFEVELAKSWSSLVGVHGGYMCAIAVRAASDLVPDRPVRTMTTSFLRTGRVGPATVSVREVRRGRAVSTVFVDLVQNDSIVTTTRLTMIAETGGVEWSSPSSLSLPPLADCVPINSPNGVAHFAQAEALLDPSSLPFSSGERARVSGYVRPLESRAVDTAWLAMMVDWFPPPAFVRIAPPTGGVSIDLTTHIHQPNPVLVDDQWLTGAFEVVTSTGGVAVEHGRIVHPNGTLVAESFQTRWTAQS